MKDRLQQLLALFMSARPATRITLVLGTIVVGAIAFASSWFAARPDLVQLWSGMSSAEAAEYKNALAQAGIAFRSSPPPENGIWVDVEQRMEAEAQVAMAGYRPVEKGIRVTVGGAASAFLDAGSREQMVNKREWQECELQLERLVFVTRATVTSSGGDTSPYGGGREPTISVTLGLRNGMTLNSSEARTVAALVRSRFNVPLENITVVDEHGHLLHDGMDASGGMSRGELFSIKRRYDSDAEREAMKLLDQALGRGMATVTVNSSWIFDSKESIEESALPSSAPYFESSSKTKSSGPSAPQIGGAVGISSNINPEDFGNENAGPGSTGGGSAEQSSDTKETRSSVGHKTEHLTSRTPKISRLTLALVVDASKADKLKEIEGVVKAAVGFDEDRDKFELLSIPLASVERDEDGQPIAPAAVEPVPEPNRYLELALQHGVEILAALGFLLVLMKSLKSASNLKPTLAPASTESPGAGSSVQRGSDLTQDEIDQMDMELLARAQVEELVRTDPEKVSEILAQWVKATAGPVGVGK